MKQRVLIFGGSSQLAPVLIDSLGSDFEFVVTTSSPPGRFHASRNVREAGYPRDKPLELKESIGGDWDAIVSLVPITALPDLLPVLGNSRTGRFVALSTASVQTKANTRSPLESAFLESVEAGETAFWKFCSENGIPGVLLRPAMTYGGADNNIGFIRRMGKRFGFFPVVSRSGLRQPVHVDDVVQAVMSALTSAAAIGNTYLVGGGERLTFEEMARRTVHAETGRARVVRVPATVLALVLRVLSYLPRFNYLDADMVRRMREDHVFDNGPAQRDLGIAPRRFLEDSSGEKTHSRIGNS
ncbi:MAG: hypothetical protein KY410_08305 [Proteobacteria bacterium]|nr:hypothetical protein [Pseudomonadota bacterium]